MRRGTTAGLAIAILALAGCATQATFDSYAETIGNFRKATDHTSAVAATYIMSINEFERGLVYADLEENAARKLNIVADLLEPRIDPAAIRLRAQAFDVLRRYTDTLAALAASDAGERWKAQAKALGASAGQLNKSLSDQTAADLTGLNALVGDDPETGALATLVSAAGEAYINQRRAEALDDTIVKYRPVIERISALLREDFDFVAKRRKFIATKALHPLGESYNAAVDRGDDAKRRKLLGTIKTAVTAYEKKVVEIGEIQQALDGFDRAHDALVAYARSDKGPDDLGVLVGEIERYAAVARTLFEAVTAATASEPG